MRPAPVRHATMDVVFTEDLVRRYGGQGPHIHADVDVAARQGFAAVVVWGTLVLLPFSMLLKRIAGDPAIAATLDARLRQPVLVNQAVRYECRLHDPTGAAPAIALSATRLDGTVVASGTASFSPTSTSFIEGSP